ncbi:programmed cell death protein 4 [Cylas formicarius]|uniref:programmed cell death protein 4 n=1 Tax=Cylas formicarius TaxID=197179 RepID=UPI0029584486|nr:programmed cell death protein 4 [Cylas formicarius]
MAHDRGDIAVDNIDAEEVDIEKAVEREMEMAAKENATSSSVEAATKRKPRKMHRQNSKEAGAPNAGGFVHKARSWKNSRRSRNGYGRGLPKKGGAGGKGVWGVPGSELLEAYEDVNDPNFDAENLSNGDIELKAVVPEETNEEIRNKCVPIILEYFESNDAHEAALSVQEMIPINRRDVFVEQAIQTAMDHKPSHRELTSVLISDLYGYVVTEFDIVKAFENLLSNINDLILDIPDAPVILGNFIARAIADDCIPPRFIVATKEKSDDPKFQEALIRADTLLSMKHGLVRLDNVWGIGGPLRPVHALIRQMTLLLQEFVSAGDVEEAARCLAALEVPHFHHELVYEAIVMALEANNQATELAICKLLKAFDTAILITTDQMERGFFRVFDDLPDISMDVPLAYVILDRFIDLCRDEGFLTSNVVKRWPSRGRKRFVSEGDHFISKGGADKNAKVREY